MHSHETYDGVLIHTFKQQNVFVVVIPKKSTSQSSHLKLLNVDTAFYDSGNGYVPRPEL